MEKLLDINGERQGGERGEGRRQGRAGRRRVSY